MSNGTVARFIDRAMRPLHARAALVLSACAIGALFGSSAHATPPPVITSVTVTSYSTGDNRSIALPQTQIPELVIRGTNFFTDGSTPGSILQPQILIHRTGYADLAFSPSANIWSGDNTDGTIIIRSANLTGYTPGMFDVIVKRNPSINLGETTFANAFELKPQGPERLVRRGGFGGPINRSQAAGNRLYLNSGPRFVILDTTNESSPVQLGSIDLLTPILDFQIQGHYAFVCTQSSTSGGGGANGFCVVDIANPAAPQLVWSGGGTRGIIGAASQPNSCLDPVRIWLKGSFAYVASAGATGIYIYNISNPTSPQFVRSVLSNGSLVDGLQPGCIEIFGNNLYGWSYVGGAPGFLRVYNLGSGPDVPVQIAQVQCSNGVVGSTDLPVCMATAPGLLAFVTDGIDDADFPQLSIWNISNPAAPVLASKTPLNRSFTSLAIASGLLYGAEEERYVPGTPNAGEFVGYPDFYRGLVTYDITDPANPTFLSTLKTHGSVYGVEAAGSRVYVRDHGDGLSIVDTSNPSAPMRLGGLFSPSSIRDVARNGNFLYVSDQYTGFTVLNISNPDRPVVVGVYQVDHEGDSDLQGNWGIAYNNGKVYLAVGDGASSVQQTCGIDVVDVSDPAHPVLVQAYDARERDSFRGLEVDGGVLRATGNAKSECCAGSYLTNFTIDPVDGTITFLADIQAPPTIVPVYAANPQTRAGYTFCEFGIIDNHDPAHPTIASALPASCGFALAGNTMFTRGVPTIPNTLGLFVCDASNPAGPSPLAPVLGHAEFFGTNGIASNGADRMFMSGEAMQIIGGASGLLVFDSASSRLVAGRVPFTVSMPRDNFNVQSSMLKASGSLIFSADRVGTFRREFRQRVGQGLMIVEHVRPPACPPDFNGVGGLNVQDIFDFLGAWFAADARADFNHQGGITVQDIFDFLSAWFSGC